MIFDKNIAFFIKPLYSNSFTDLHYLTKAIKNCTDTFIDEFYLKKFPV